MATKVILPKMGANMEEGMIGRWLKKEGASVKKDEVLFELITDKATFEIVAEETGILKKILLPANVAAPVSSVVAIIGAKNEKIDQLLKEVETTAKSKPSPIAFSQVEDERPVRNPPVAISFAKPSYFASPLVKRLAKERGIDLTKIKGSGPNGRIIEKDLAKTPLVNPEVEKIAIIGAGSIGELVVNILSKDQTKEIVGFFDDHLTTASKNHSPALPVLGKLSQIVSLYRKKIFQKTIITMGLNLPLKKAIYDLLKKNRIGLINAISPQAIIDDRVTIGHGNIINSAAHLGYGSIIGDNNFISSSVNLDHHNRLGSHCLIAPGSATSGFVEIGDLCSIGAGVFIQNVIKIGNNVSLASGSIVYADIPNNYEIRSHLAKEALPIPKKVMLK